MENFKRIDSHWINPESPWNMIRGKYLFENPKTLNKNSKENNLLSLTLNGVLNKDMDSGGGLRPDSYESYQIFYENDLVFKLIDLENVKTSRVGWVHERGLMSPVYIRLKPKEDKTNTRYFYYYFFDLYQRHIFNSIGSGIRSSLSGTNLLELLVPNPSHEEQNKIVSFLDKKTTQIDKLIKKIEQKIELLKEQRNSIIDEVVTQGLNPNVEKKESGVEWIGEIPSHWEISKLKYLVSENQESLSNSTDPDLELDYIEISDVNSIGEFKKPTKYIFSESPSRCRRICRKGDIIISTVRTYLKSIGIIEEQRENLICSTGFSVLTPKSQYLSKFIFYMLRSNWFISKIISRSEGVSYPSIQSHKLLGTDVIIMDKQEQQKIVEFLDEETQKIDKTICKEEKRIELLKEYKQSLISEVVTGKKRVV